MAMLNVGMLDLSFRDKIFQALIQNSTDIITILDLQGKVIYESPSVLRITGFQPEELLNKNIFEFIHIEDQKSVLSAFNKLINSPNQAQTSSLRFLKKFGGWCHLEVIGTNLLHVPEIQGIVINSRDITERKKFEQALAESESKLRSLINHSSDVILLISRTGKILFANNSIQSVLEFSSEQILGIQFQSFIHPEEAETFNQMLHKIFQSENKTDRCEVRCRHKNNIWKILEIFGINLLENSCVKGVLINARDITERKVYEERLQFLAWKDPLTQLYNRTFFTKCISDQFLQKNRNLSYSFALLLLDLDRFKVVNDSLGHTAGDQLLHQLAHRLTKCVRPTDTIARLGGDEFAILLTDISKVEQVLVVAKRITAILQTPFHLEGREVFSSVSIGIALSNSSNETPQELLRDADTALYRAKEDGRGKYAIFDAQMHQHAVQFLKVETDLRKALRVNALEVYYQPIVCLQTQKLKGFEALARWNDPAQGYVSPNTFIPIAEETGLIEPLGSWVLSEACRKLQTWKQTWQQKADFYISINISAKQFKHMQFVDGIQTILMEYAVLPDQICLEITESVLIQNPDAATDIFQKLRQIGVKLFMDDFGTGYSSLSYLQRFPVDALKIDRSFIHKITSPNLSNEIQNRESLGNIEIVKAISSLANNLGIKVIAEGIEDQTQMKALQMLKCDCGQGFWFAKPMNSKTVDQFLKNYFSDNQSVI